MDEKTGLFVSGEEKQINYASQVWLILAGAVSIEEGRAMLDKLDELKPEKSNGLSIHEPSLCRSTFDVRQKRPGNGLYEILLGRHDQSRCGYFLGALQSGKSGRVSIWKQYRKQLLPCMELYTNVPSEKIFP